MDPDRRTIYLPERWPVSIHVDDWPRVGGASTTNTSGRAAEWDRRGGDTPARPTERYLIDVYRWDDQHIVAGLRTDSRHTPLHNTGRLLDDRDAVVPAVRAVARELTHDGAIRRVLIQAVLASLTPDHLDPPSSHY